MKYELAAAANLVNQLDIDHSVKRSLAVDKLIQLNRKEASEIARNEQQDYSYKIVVARLNQLAAGYDTNRVASPTDPSFTKEQMKAFEMLSAAIERYPGAWGLAGKILPFEVFFGNHENPNLEANLNKIGTSTKIADEGAPVKNVGKAGGSRAAGVPAVVDQDSAEIRARSTRTAEASK